MSYSLVVSRNCKREATLGFPMLRLLNVVTKSAARS